jgi:lysophospholipase L1-like esterase
VSIIRRRRSVRVALRVLLVLASCELTLRLGAWLIERHAPSAAASPDAPILCIGDSNTFGVGAPPGRSYPDQLRDLLHAAGDPREVVNLGFPGLDSDQIVGRLERALASTRPSCVLFLAGYNDWSRATALIDGVEDGAEESHGAFARMLSWSVTLRMLLTATHVLRGDTAHSMFGGERAIGLPEPASVDFHDWDAEYERAKQHGFDAASTWIRFFFTVEDSPRIDRVLADLRARSDLERVKRTLRYPLRDLEWEADVLAGRAPPKLAVDPAEPPEGRQFALYAAAWRAMEDGHADQARVALANLELLGSDPWASNFRNLLLAWCTLQARDFAVAAQQLSVVADRAAALSPEVGLENSLGGAAVATLLADESARLATFVAAHPAWERLNRWIPTSASSDWMEAALCIDAMRSGDAARAQETWNREEGRLGGKPVTATLRWILAHRDATFGQLRRELPLEPPRTSWIGTCVRVFRDVRADEFRSVTSAADRRLASLAATHDFQVVVLTYLDYDATMQHERLCRLAAERGWPLVDLEHRWTREVLGADDKSKYFIPDRAHPNEAGYGLMARAVFEVMSANHLVRAAR